MDSTLVVAWGEFGRTPRVNEQGRPGSLSKCVQRGAGGGPIKGGRVLGSSDAKGAFPRDLPKSPQDVLATIYRHLGVDYDTALSQRGGSTDQDAAVWLADHELS